MNKYYHLKCMLHNLSESENNNEFLSYYQRNYYKGLIVGAVSALMNQNTSFDKACGILLVNLPDDCISLDEILPVNWDENFIKGE